MSIRATTNPYQHLMFWESLYIVFVLVLLKGVSKILIVFFLCGCFSHSRRCVTRIGYFLSLKFEIIKYYAKCRKIDCLLSSWYTEIWIRNTFENFIHTLNISWTRQSSPMFMFMFQRISRIYCLMVFLPILLSLFSDLSVIHTVHLSNLKLNHNNFKSIYTKRYLIRQLAVLSHNPSIKATGIKLTHQTCFLNSFSEGLNHRVWEKRFVSMSGLT